MVMKTYNVIARDRILLIGGESEKDAIAKSGMAGCNVFAREVSKVRSYDFTADLVTAVVKRTRVLPQMSASCIDVLDYAENRAVNVLDMQLYEERLFSEHILIGLLIKNTNIASRFLRKKGVTLEKVLKAKYSVKRNENSIPAHFLVSIFLDTILRFGVYLDTRTLFLSIFREGTNVEKIIRFMGYDIGELVQEYISFCNISEYFLNNPGYSKHNNNCPDGIDIYKYVRNQSDRQNRITMHLRECDGLCLKTADYVKSSPEQIESEKKKPELLW